MKLTELITILQRTLDEYGDRDVLCTWEGTTPEIDAIYIAKSNLPHGDTRGGELLIDCDCASYQSTFAETVIWGGR